MQNSTYPAYQKYYVKSFRSTLLGFFALWAHTPTSGSLLAHQRKLFRKELRSLIESVKI